MKAKHNLRELLDLISLFPLGKIVATPGAWEALAEQSPFEYLNRHAQGDWGDLDEHDRQVNEHAMKHGYRLFSAYKTKRGQKLWIITEADRSVTTLLLPEEY